MLIRYSGRQSATLNSTTQHLKSQKFCGIRRTDSRQIVLTPVYPTMRVKAFSQKFQLETPEVPEAKDSRFVELAKMIRAEVPQPIIHAELPD